MTDVFVRFRNPDKADMFIVQGDLTKVGLSWKQETVTHKVKQIGNVLAIRIIWYKNDLLNHLKQQGFKRLDEYSEEASQLFQLFERKEKGW